MTKAIELSLVALLAVLATIAVRYGYTYSMTDAAFPIAGYIGTLIPLACMLFAFAIGLYMGKE